MPEDLIQSAVRYFQQHENELRKLRLPENAIITPVPTISMRWFLVLVEQKQGDKEMRDWLYEHRPARAPIRRCSVCLPREGEKERRDGAGIFGSS
jgi:hypothetical protein